MPQHAKGVFIPLIHICKKRNHVLYRKNGVPVTIMKKYLCFRVLHKLKQVLVINPQFEKANNDNLLQLHRFHVTRDNWILYSKLGFGKNTYHMTQNKPRPILHRSYQRDMKIVIHHIYIQYQGLTITMRCVQHLIYLVSK